MTDLGAAQQKCTELHRRIGELNDRDNRRAERMAQVAQEARILANCSERLVALVRPLIAEENQSHEVSDMVSTELRQVMRDVALQVIELRRELP